MADVAQLRGPERYLDIVCAVDEVGVHRRPTRPTEQLRRWPVRWRFCDRNRAWTRRTKEPDRSGSAVSLSPRLRVPLPLRLVADPGEERRGNCLLSSRPLFGEIAEAHQSAAGRSDVEREVADVPVKR